MKEIKLFTEHLKNKGLSEDGFSKEMWSAIIDYFYVKDVEKLKQ